MKLFMYRLASVPRLSVLDGTVMVTDAEGQVEGMKETCKSVAKEEEIMNAPLA